jgi:hypothetical protein
MRHLHTPAAKKLDCAVNNHLKVVKSLLGGAAVSSPILGATRAVPRRAARRFVLFVAIASAVLALGWILRMARAHQRLEDERWRLELVRHWAAIHLPVPGLQAELETEYRHGRLLYLFQVEGATSTLDSANVEQEPPFTVVLADSAGFKLISIPMPNAEGVGGKDTLGAVHSVHWNSSIVCDSSMYLQASRWDVLSSVQLRQ